jgi:hypothetical protein
MTIAYNTTEAVDQFLSTPVLWRDLISMGCILVGAFIIVYFRKEIFG